MVCGTVLLVVSLLSPPSFGNDKVHLVVAESARYYQQVADTLVTNIRQNHPDTRVDIHRINDLPALELQDDALLICIGTKAGLEAVKHYPNQPQLNLFITAAAWKNLTHHLPTSRKANLFIDQPAERLFALARVMAPDARNFATVLGPISAANEAQLAASAKNAGIALTSEVISADSNPLAVLTPLLEDADVFLATPDNAVINRTIARWALFLAFKHKIPVIGFSQAYRNAGAAAALYTSPDDISRHATEWLDTYITSPHFDSWESVAPKYFTVSVNPSVVRTLGLKHRDPEQVQESVLQLLGNNSP